MENSPDKWNSRWSEKAKNASWRPDPWLQRALPWLSPGSVLDIACGMGRNTIYLAELGYKLTAVDVSEVALELLCKEAKRRALTIDTLQLDLESGVHLPDGPFDLLLNFFYLHRALLSHELSRVRPGGIAVFRTFSQAGADRFGTARPDISLMPGELLELFSDWEILLHEEGEEPSAKGGSLAGIVARRPA